MKKKQRKLTTQPKVDAELKRVEESGWFAKPVIVFLVLIALSSIAYSNSFHVPFHFDDLRLIRFNFSLRDLGNWKGILSSEPFRPLLVGTFALNFKLSQSDPFTYHVLNLAFHILAVCLFYLFIKRVSKSPFISFAAAAVMAVHPLNTESVTYISSRSIVLCAVFYFLSLLSFDNYLQKGKRGWLVCFCLCFLFAMSTKEEGALIPFVALFYNGVMNGSASIQRHKWLHIMTCSFVLLLAVIRMVMFFRFSQQLPYPYLIWLPTQINVWIRYLWKAAVPVSLNVDPDITALSFTSLTFWISSACIAALVSYCLKIRQRHPFVTFWGIWFVINLLASSAVPLTDFYADHRAYISLFGFCACLAYVAQLASERFRSASFAVKTAVYVLIVVFTFATYQRNEIWKSEVSLWSDAARKSPQKIRPHLNLAGSYFNRKEYDLAIQEYQFVRRLNPENAQVHAGLGICYLRKRELGLAESAFQRALELDQNHIDAKTGLGIIRYTQGRYAEALDYFRQVYPYRRESIQLVDLMSSASMKTDNYQEAIRVLEPAINLDGARPAFYLRLAEAYENNGEPQKAQILRQQYASKFQQ